MKKTACVAFTLVLVSAVAFGQSKSSPLTGAWRVTQVQRTGPNAGTVNNPQPGLYLFTGNHYSIQSVNSDKPRPTLPQDTAKSTGAELNATWGPFTANTGTYEIQGNTLTTHPIVAKNPNVMAPGTANTYSFKIEGKTLTLTAVKNTLGPVTNPTTLKLTRVE
jgi:Lipocalin-like domain